MNISIRIKFSIFLASLLSVTVLLLSVFVLRGIHKNQQQQYEQYLAQQTKTANTYLIQSILSQSNKNPHSFLKTNGEAFIDEFTLLSGQSIVLYDMFGTAVSKRISRTLSSPLSETLGYALDNKIAYLIEDDTLYYMAPLTIGGEQVGVIQLYYSLASHNAFYKQIKGLFISIGTGIFLASFICGYIYFNYFAKGIISLNHTVERIGKGDYQVRVLKRRDELGMLSRGIVGMSQQIQNTLQEMGEEQNKLEKAVKKLSALDKQQKQFLGNVTHEFKTPLTSIKAYLDLLEMYPDDTELLISAKSTIKSETQRLYDMVEKVLELSALEKYAFEYQSEEVELQEIILSVLTSLQGKLNKFQIHLQVNLIEVYAKIDRDSFRIVLMNLLDNAIKYNKPEGDIYVHTYVHEDNVFIEIQDTGIGIPKEVADKIFEPFYTVDKNRARENGGVGLGLALAKKYARLQGGDVQLVETSQEGTHFRIILNLK